VLGAVALVGALVAVRSAVGHAGVTAPIATPAAAGERLYRDGQLPSGGAVQATVRGDTVDGRVVACVTCHQRSGLGTVEGRIAAPAINGRTLYAPLVETYRNVELTGTPPKRPAYTDETLAAAIRSGVDPTGRQLDAAMPRFDLPDAEMAALVSYLKTLSAKPSAGVSESTIRVATIVTDDVAPDDREAMLFVLRKYVSLKNGQTQAYGDNHDNRAARMLSAMSSSRELVGKRLELDVWELHGEPETWRSQLEAKNAKAPVFAILSGLTNREWRPVHEFSERSHVPALFPITSLPVVSDQDWYTEYLSAGLQEEGEAAARFLAGHDHVPGAVVEVVRDTAEGGALAHGFETAWREAGRGAPVRVVHVPAGATIDVRLVRSAAGAGAETTALVWDGPAALPAIRELTSGESGMARVVVSSSYLGRSAEGIEEASRARTYFTYPYRLAADEKPFEVIAQGWLGAAQVDPSSRRYRIASAAFAATSLFSQALMELRGRYSAELFLEVIGMMPDPKLPSFEHASFGPNQRYAVKGSYVTQLTPGSPPSMIKRTDWLTH
jgi:mono/diheme cytochrome c family protein